MVCTLQELKILSAMFWSKSNPTVPLFSWPDFSVGKFNFGNRFVSFLPDCAPLFVTFLGFIESNIRPGTQEASNKGIEVLF